MSDVKNIAYLTGCFPTLPETFILNEVLYVSKQANLSVFSLKIPKREAIHSDFKTFRGDIFYSPYFFSINLWKAQLHFLWKSPRKYFATLLFLIKSMSASRDFLTKSLALYPKFIFYSKIMKDLKIKHVHAHWATHPTTGAFVINKLTGIPYSFTAHAHDIYLDRTMLKEKIKNASFVVTISNFNRKYLIENYGKISDEKIYVIRTGANTRRFKPICRKRINPDSFTILSVGRLTPMKGHSFLIKACMILAKRGRNFQCLIVGVGEEEKKLKKLVKSYGLQKKVIFKGGLPHQELELIYHEIDIFILPSIKLGNGLTEGIPVALMEAMAAGVPVIATNISGIPELVENMETGLLVPPDDSEALSDAIENLINDPFLCQKLIKNATMKIAQDFDALKNAEKLTKLLIKQFSSCTVSH